MNKQVALYNSKNQRAAPDNNNNQIVIPRMQHMSKMINVILLVMPSFEDPFMNDPFFSDSGFGGGFGRMDMNMGFGRMDNMISDMRN